MIANRTSKSGYWQGNTWKPTTATGGSTLANSVTSVGNFSGTMNSSYGGTWTTVSPVQQTLRWIEVCTCGETNVIAECLVCNRDLCFGCFITHYADRHAQEALKKYEETTSPTP